MGVIKVDERGGVKVDTPGGSDVSMLVVSEKAQGVYQQDPPAVPHQK